VQGVPPSLPLLKLAFAVIPSQDDIGSHLNFLVRSTAHILNRRPSPASGLSLNRFLDGFVLQMLDGLCQFSQSTRLDGVPSVLEALS